jgi:hypothetical protein
MRPSLLEDDVVHHEDFELARSVKWELMQLRYRSTTPTADDVMLIARKAGLAEFLHTRSRTTVEVVRADAWLAICTLADSIARNARSIREDQHDRVIDTSLLWAERLISATRGCVPRSNPAIGGRLAPTPVIEISPGHQRWLLAQPSE